MLPVRLPVLTRAFAAPVAVGLVGALALSAATPASAETAGLYGRLDLGASFSRSLSGNWLDPTSNGFGGKIGNTGFGGVGVGYALDNGLRADLVLTYRPNFRLSSSQSDSFGNSGAAKADVRQGTLMANFYYDIPASDVVRPFIGGGVGVARNTVRTIAYTLNGVGVDRENGTTTNRFAWSATAGVAVMVAPSVMVDTAFRYLDAGSIRSSGKLASGANAGALKGRLTSNELLTSLRLSF